MRARRIATTALGLAAFLAVLAVISSQPKPYKVRFQLNTANGLRKGSPVKVGGVTVGTIKSFKIGPGDYPIAEANLDAKKAHVGRGASARIVTTNLLGSKVLELIPGQGRLPSGTLIPRARISTPVDLDQVLDVLGPDTRSRLAVLINEAGAAVTGRKMDFNQALDLLPQDLHAGTRLLDQVVTDNHSLRDAVAASSQFVSRVAQERAQLSRLVGSAGQTMQAVATQHQALSETLTRAPGTLQSLQRFLGDLRTTTQPLGPAARAITATAPGLTSTLAQLGPFQRAADPALQQAIKAAPALMRLGDQATPVIRHANPTLGSLATFSTQLAPLSRTLNLSIDDTLGLIEGWARAIQDRDGVGHMFHGKATIGPDFFRALVNAPLSTNATSRRAGKRSQRQPSVRLPQLPAAATKPLSKLLEGITNRLPRLTSKLAPPPVPRDTRKILDFLLGP